MEKIYQDNVWSHFQSPQSLSKTVQVLHLFNSLQDVWSNAVFHVLYIATQNFCYCIKRHTRGVALPKVVVLQWKHPLEKYRKGKGTFHSSFVRAMELTCQEHNPSMEIVKTKVFASKYVKLQRKIWRHDWSLQLYTT